MHSPVVAKVIDNDSTNGRPKSTPLARPQTAKSSGRELPIRGRSADIPATMVESQKIAANVGLDSIDDIASSIRSLIEEECIAMEIDIEFLNQCLEGERDHRYSYLQLPLAHSHTLQSTTFKNVKSLSFDM
eukprot:m.223367 g.223367  ORF g.223367 m.223367 type:complete len:131 (+) comp15139_c0_seq7:664-1056(+)